MQFSPIEMASMYNQAPDKRRQIQAFMELNGQTEEEVKVSLLEGGIKPQQLPRQKAAQKAAARKPAPPKKEPISAGQAADRPDLSKQFEELNARLMRLCQLGGFLATGFQKIEEELKAMEAAAADAAK